jgi:hypothetical protein
MCSITQGAKSIEEGKCLMGDTHPSPITHL